MRKFSISQLETARKNAKLFGKNLNADSKGSSFGGRPKSVRWLDAVNEYHNTSDISKAINKLTSSFSQRKDTSQNRKELESLINALENYVAEHIIKDYIFLEKSHNIEIVLSGKVRITGWIWILNMTSSGNRAGYFVSKNISDISWTKELKYPIIQKYISDKIYGCDTSEVEVGVIDFTTGKHHSKIYSKKEIQKAENELLKIGTDITLQLT